MDRGSNSNQPGQLIVPHNDSDNPEPAKSGSPEPERPTEQPPEQTPPAPVAQPEPVAHPATTPVPDAQDLPTQSATIPEPATGWQFHAESGAALPAENALKPGEEVTWTASEFIAHEKSVGWYVLLTLAALGLAALAYFVTSHDLISTVAILLMALAFGLFAGRKPKVQQYRLSGTGLHIGEKTYTYQGFRSFSVAEEGAVVSVVFMPLKRFMPSLTIYLAPDMEEKVLSVLAERLPMEQHRQDAVDGFLKRIRF